ncbi:MULTISPECIES: hypothetical protein [Halomonadaceae]|jgi:hypothetical protein|uniref:hypothetical protein n=1 Tax=Halomonadaceae TaxID=28256 RepID=UPI0015838B58|nr:MULTISPECIES: hypothetical protein [Halomonas]MDI4636404.1 hypothetical protein [Halomonas sp. BMC7]NUJ60768.1 hypothetical protein [Halomonas taeanensis]|tara:strand:- start:10827 stop:11231 length:405 start_codon:yes stop_codon:yes gene_type:complete
MCAVRIFLPRYKAILIAAGLIAAAGMSQLSYADTSVSSTATGFDDSNSLDMEEMQQERGREGINLTNVQSIQNIDTSVDTTSFNVSGDVVTGNVNIQPDSLNSYSGVGVFNITTGNANAVSGAVGISVYIANPQ